MRFSFDKPNTGNLHCYKHGDVDTFPTVILSDIILHQIQSTACVNVLGNFFHYLVILRRDGGKLYVELDFTSIVLPIQVQPTRIQVK